MAINIGSTEMGSIYLGSTEIGEIYHGSVKVYSSADPLNPLGLPPYTMRLEFATGVTPSSYRGTFTQVSSSPNVWDWTYQNVDWESMLSNKSNLIKVLGANSTGVQNFQGLFDGDYSLASTVLFDTSSATRIGAMYNNCSSLAGQLPLYNTSNVSLCFYAFSGCTKVTGGALALYNQLKTNQYTASWSYQDTFTNCGRDTVTGAAELAQIPSSWGGLA